MPEPDKNLTASQEPDAAAVYLAGIAALEQAATPGPWTLETDRDGEGDDNWEFPYGIRMPVPHTERPDGTHRDFDYLYSELAEMTMATAEFIVAARSAVPRLLGAVQIALKQHRPVPAVRLVPCEEHKHWRGSLVGVPEFGQEFETENLRVRRACPDCQVFDEPYCRACVDDDRTYQDWPCKPYRDITAELLKTEGT